MSIPNDYKRSIEEIVILYKLEKNIKDLYVEGKSDRFFLEWHLKKMGVIHLNIYTIEDIFIPPEVLFKKGYEDNNRDRVLFLICCLNEDISIDKYKGIIDKDILYFTRGLPVINNVLLTDYSCFEMYAYNKEVFTKINDTGFSHKIPNNLFIFINNVLLFTTAIRIFEKRMCISINKPELKKYITSINNKLDFEEKKYLSAIQSNNNVGLSYDNFSKKISDISIELQNNDVKDFSNGHDFITITNCSLKELGIISRHITDDAIKAIIMVAIDTESLKTYNLFMELNKFYMML